ncbi:Maternal effect protein oskar [Pseudolycoriella hygida]|uniref:Maternal effect protein oskar n=1 Tax=Pseudolycoriella hygida TaxID=35572 RepID=A0A9Q0N378_9DIPT|nr:Maternal effect protein oskar [Pseudolycoriella hygida]
MRRDWTIMTSSQAALVLACRATRYFVSFIYDEFEFLLEMVILSRNENGATLYEIRDDLIKHFGLSFEDIWGYNCWEEHFRPMLSNIMPNITSKTLNGGCIVYFMNLDAAISKSYDASENMALICSTLEIDLNKLKEARDANISESDSIEAIVPKSTSSRVSTVSDSFYGHFLIGDNFFLELSHIDLRKKLTKSRVKQIGYCVSGETIFRAIKRISSSVISDAYQGAIINLGSVDLLRGKELVDIKKDMVDLCEILCEKNIFPIVTTIPPLANQMHNKVLEQKRKAFNTFLLEKFDCIDIEPCFLSNLSHILFDLYHPEPKNVPGSNRPMVLWNHVGRQRVVKMLKRKIPEIYGEY